MPTTKARPDPIIPDHEVLRKIGGGAYGEVWLARGVTGALRAVKVVWREDFDDERTFEREFEGILKYEPLSRDHPGLVNILHVGRSLDEPGFYYYVMELGDDVATGPDINPVEYEARTLRSDMTRSGKHPLDTGFCLDVGLRLAEALRHLHENGLAHRDVKPSNVIFVNGRAKLADIGLVAARGQRTFVGTEGFVPPEGPGSAQADVYSLGKVLYEMATGKDRLDFPELPDELPTGPERRQWLDLNRIICEICEPAVSKRAIRNADELVEALARAKSGQRRRRRRPIGAMVMAGAAGAIVVWGGWTVAHRSDGMVTPEPRKAFIKVTSTPSEADVIEFDGPNDVGELIGRTPTEVLEAKVGETISLRFLLPNYAPYETTVTVPPEAAEEAWLISATLKRFSPPVETEPWTDHLGDEFRPVGEAHESVDPVKPGIWREYAEASGASDAGVTMLAGGSGRPEAVSATPEAREAFLAWYVESGIEAGFLTRDFEAIAEPAWGYPQAGDGKEPFRLLVRPIPYGRFQLRTAPPGAAVYLDGKSVGTTDEAGRLTLDKIQPGEHRFKVTLEGFQSESRVVVLDPKGQVDVGFELKPNMSVVLGRAWTNSLGMRFVPIVEGWMASVWETRWADFQTFADATGTEMPEVPEWLESMPRDEVGNHPVVSVSRDEAERFCQWLTEKEQAEERLTPTLEYRLPTDLEWSLMSGVEETAGVSPARRDQLKSKTFPWGGEWPPVQVIGNLADVASGNPLSRRVEDYDDGFAYTAPVGSFPSNGQGVQDLCGNVQEWVSDAYSSSARADGSGVLRGGGWRSYQEKDLYIGSRNPQPPPATDDSYGFRVVLAKRPESAFNSNDEEDG